MENRNTKNNKNKSGFTLIEALVFLFIFTIVTMTFYSVATTGLRYISETKKRLGASALANEKMEIARNLDYANVGTVGGFVPGNIPQTETVDVNTVRYYVFTSVDYFDDPFDGTNGGSPNDTAANDYKKVTIRVAWENNVLSQKSVSLVSTFPPPGLEASVPQGTFSINVLDNTGAGISDAEVHIVNASKGIDTVKITDSTGNILITGAAPGTQAYTLDVSKSGYYPVQTYPPYPTTPLFNPTDINASVVANSVNMKALITDRYADLNIYTKDPFGNSIPNILFSLTGGKKIGTLVSSPTTDKYAYEGNLNSGSGGNSSLSNQSSGSYIFTFTDPMTDYQFLKLDAGQAKNNIFSAVPNATTNVNAIFLDKSINSLLVTVINDGDGSFVDGAAVQLKNDTIPFDVTVTTDKYGQAYFPTALPELEGADYDLKITAAGFDENNSTVTVNNLTVRNINLTSD
jgi:type II secretory pathway pseudopilin PulG